jgi:hypothetical protein
MRQEQAVFGPPGQWCEHPQVSITMYEQEPLRRGFLSMMRTRPNTGIAASRS